MDFDLIFVYVCVCVCVCDKGPAFARGDPVIPARFVEKSVLFPAEWSWYLAEDQLARYVRAYFWALFYPVGRMSVFMLPRCDFVILLRHRWLME